MGTINIITEQPHRFLRGLPRRLRAGPSTEGGGTSLETDARDALAGAIAEADAMGYTEDDEKQRAWQLRCGLDAARAAAVSAGAVWTAIADEDEACADSAASHRKKTKKSCVWIAKRPGRRCRKKGAGTFANIKAKKAAPRRVMGAKSMREGGSVSRRWDMVRTRARLRAGAWRRCAHQGKAGFMSMGVVDASSA